MGKRASIAVVQSTWTTSPTFSPVMSRIPH